jgi:hypothetical protein
MIRFTTSLSSLAAAVLLSAGFAACTETPVQVDPPGGISVPTTYTFQSRFDTTKSSVDYNGQIVRNMLITDLTSTLSSLGKAGATAVTEADLLALYEHSDAANLMTKISVSGRELLQKQYNQIATGKKLSDKIASSTVIGMNATPDALIRGWLATAAQNSQDPSKLGTPAAIFDEAGRDIPEMVGKLLLGAVSYYQATSVYLGNVLTKDNSVAADNGSGGKLAYSVMEHNWDEAFGYFGAARDYARYTDALLTGTSADYTYDSNGDGKIDLASEYNYTLARYAARRDNANVGSDFTKDIFDAFLKGRTAIVNQGTVTDITAHRNAAVMAWEKLMAASLVHYLNGVKSELAAIGSTEFDPNGYRHEWSEMKGFAAALQFNSAKMISDAQLAQLHTLIGASPTVFEAGSQELTAYQTALASAASLIKSAYGFTDAQINGW